MSLLPAKLTKFGCIIMSPGKEPLDMTSMLLTQTSHMDYEELWRLDVLGLSDTPTNDQRNLIVSDASARAFEDAPSLNDCLHAGPPLQNKLWSVLVRGRFNPVAVSGDLQKAFLQVRIKEADRDAMRFHWR